MPKGVLTKLKVERRFSWFSKDKVVKPSEENNHHYEKYHENVHPEKSQVAETRWV
jgi:hypothetical protein